MTTTTKILVIDSGHSSNKFMLDTTSTQMYGSIEKAGDGKVGGGSKKKGPYDKDSEEYKRRRERNNEAVRRSRKKSRQKASETEERVNALKKENAELEQRVTTLNKELELLKDLFLSHAKDLPDPSTTFGLVSANPSLGTEEANPALSKPKSETEDTQPTLLEVEVESESFTLTAEEHIYEVEVITEES